ncbi:triosephosphate isomerase [Neoehrlichia mikurensis]|uniref:Triosephosphate isomerase n=1 Tax=Neoehrlichia mikurensis TaxID=89586 RepID=A0A9Q9BS20_9RICK|nr:triosephosphate isomerase [Neoehrlichia mikurensis]QXK91932.1 triosephosphate isomerase [Neoehrlichia mikurensis]QXK93145.1 triosephosphate isomerase [Neoehrlichia mikurensis]QXK93625.1 triosephosphate isomerase [Neoehrlichia mikurensis]UTO55420.1 triosephosphate isomerase [Neoehrlichia mikurensis]UTO56339.1 triosephosphate isomerase [Neoehrlichia mikurensis]
MSFIVIANWKMNGFPLAFMEFCKSLNSFLIADYLNKKDLTIVLCPPFISMSGFIEFSSMVKLGAQNCYYKESGQYTGEISASMLKKCNCKYVIVGHSERRQLFYESDNEVKLKAQSVIDAGLIPIVCIGETLADRNNGITRDVLLSQCEKCLPNNGEFIIAYEPIWAIGNSTLPSIELINKSFDIIKSYINSCKLIYGGSVNYHNIHDIQKIQRLDGVIVGNASLNVDSFYKIICNIDC